MAARLHGFLLLRHPMDPAEAGSKATHLAHLASLGAVVPPSVVVPARAHADALAAAQGGKPCELSREMLQELPAALAHLGPSPWVVRTSAPDEDLPGGSAAGLFLSELGLRSKEAVASAVARCWRASRDRLVREYLDALGHPGAPAPVGVLIQPQVAAELAGVLFTRDPTEGPRSPHLVCELARASTLAVTAGLVTPALHRLHRDGGGVTSGRLPEGSLRELLALASWAEEVVGGPADVELAFTGAGLVALQVRPITAFDRPAFYQPGIHQPTCHPSSLDQLSEGAVALGPTEEPGLPWIPDRAHNPDPLSPLHASLIERLDRIPSLPFSMRCVHGYLCYAPRPDATLPQQEDPESTCGAWPERRRHLERLVEGLEGLEGLETPRTPHGVEQPEMPEGPPPPPLRAALELFDLLYERYATLAGAPLTSSRRHLAARIDDRLWAGELTHEQLAQALGSVRSPLARRMGDLATLAATRPGLVAGLAAGESVDSLPGGAELEGRLAALIHDLGALPPVWDLAVPTLAESPGALRRALASLSQRVASDPATSLESPPDPTPARGPEAERPGESPPRPQVSGPDPRGPAISPSALANLGADEEDDLLFARGMAVLRRLCLRAGDLLLAEGRLDHREDVFRLDLETLVAALEADAGADTNLRARLLQGPGQADHVHSGAPGEAPAQHPHAPVVLRGHGIGSGEVRARALVLQELPTDLEAVISLVTGRILVCPTLLPSAVVILAHAAGVATDHGGLLSHGAILARELNLPAVLGVRGATASLRTGDLLWLDADRGILARL